MSGVRRHVFLWAQKLKNYWSFLATWGCASEFLKMLPKFKMAARGQLQNNLWAQKLSHSPSYGDVQVTFSRFLLKFKMAVWDQL